MNKLKIMKTEIVKIFELLKNYQFLITHRLAPQYFSRKCKLDLFTTVSILLNFSKKSVQSEVNHFFNQVLEVGTVTKQAFQEARNKISHTAFVELFEHTVKSGLSLEDTDLFHGYRLLAVDGSTLMLENTAELKDYFGQSTPVKNESYARISMIFDVLNEFIVDAQIVPYSTGERELAIKHVEKLKLYETGKYLLLMDRGYWKRELFEQISQSGNKFLLRVPCNSSKALNSCVGDFGFFKIKCGENSYSLRYFRFKLSSGETETLVTNLSHEEVPNEQLCELYFMRWGIETKYHELKNLLLIENFTAKSVLSVKQDFFATVLLSNFVAFAAYSAQESINEKVKNQAAKYSYKPNKNSIISALRENMIAAVVSPSPLERARHMLIIQNTFAQNPIPIRNDRSYPRKVGTYKSNRRKPKKVL